MKSFIRVLSLFFGIVLAFGLIFYFNAVQVMATPGARCVTGSDCDEGEACEENDDGEYRCVAAEEEEEEGDRAVGGFCETDSDCQAGLECQDNTCTTASGGEGRAGGGGDMCTDDSDCTGTLECVGGVCTSVDSDTSDSGTSSRSDYGLGDVPSQLRDIGEGDLVNVILRIIQYVVGLVGIILLVMFIYGGIMYMTAAGNEEQAGKAKKILTYAVIGIVIVAFSFVIAEFIVRALSGSGSSSGTSSTGSTSTSGSRLPSGSDSGSDD